MKQFSDGNGRIVVVGLCPQRGKYRKGGTRDRLHSLMRERNYDFLNCFIEYVPTNECKVRNVDAGIVNEIRSYSKVIGLGKFVESVLRTHEIDGLCIPHPSPLNRIWNDRTKFEEYKEKIDGYIRSQSKRRSLES